MKKHKEISDELKNYESTIKALHDQADALGEDDRESRTVTERLNSIDKRYQELQELAKLRKQRLLDALSLYKLFTEADGVEQWINEKEKMLVTMVPGKGHFFSDHNSTILPFSSRPNQITSPKLYF